MMTWDNVSIEQFAELQKTFSNKPVDPVDKLNQKILQVSIITGKTLEEVEKMTLKELEVIEKLLTTPLPTKIHKRFELNGVLYEFVTDAKELAGGSYMSIMESIKEDPFENLHTVMFNIAKPIKFGWKGFTSYEFEAHEIPDRIEDFKKMPISIANPIAVFFCRLSESLTNALEDSLLEKQEELMMKVQIMTREIQLMASEDGAGL